MRQENPKALEARQLRDTYHYFGCEPGFPTFRYDIIDAVKDPEGPFLCLPKIFDIRSDITTKALAEKGWAVVINEQEENFKIQDLERKIFTPARNRVMCEAFLKQAQRDPDGTIGKSIIFAVNQNHATKLTKILNEHSAGPRRHDHLAASRMPRRIAKEFRDGKRPERIAVSVDMLSTGYNCRDLLNVVLMRPDLFADRIHPDQRTRHAAVHVQDRQHRIREEVFLPARFLRASPNISRKNTTTAVPLKCPRPERQDRRPQSQHGGGEPRGGDAAGDADRRRAGAGRHAPREIPDVGGRDTHRQSEEIRIVGPDGEKVDVMTFRGSFERDVSEFASRTPNFTRPSRTRTTTTIETIMNERFYHQPEMYYSPDKLVLSYGVPAPTPAFVYNALGKKPLPTKEQSSPTPSIPSPPASISATTNRNGSMPPPNSSPTTPAALQQFLAGDMTLFNCQPVQPARRLAAPVAIRRARASL